MIAWFQRLAAALGARPSKPAHRAAGGSAARSPLWARLCLVFGVVVAVVAGGVGLGAYGVANHYDHNIKRSNLLGQSQASLTQQAGRLKGPMNILMLGSDSRTANPRGNANSTARSDTMVVLHLDRQLHHAYAISYPRDSWVYVPAHGHWHGGKNKLNAAYDIGGAPLVTRTIERLSKIDIEHVVIVDFSALRSITDAVGGVDVDITKTVRDPRSHRVFHKGRMHLNGAAALDYVRQRYDLPNSDFSRIKRQQIYLAALSRKISDSGVLQSPTRLNALLNSVTKALTVDDSMPVKELVFALRDLRPGDVKYTTLPFAGYLSTGQGDANRINAKAAKVLYGAIRHDTLAEYFSTHKSTNVTKGA